MSYYWFDRYWDRPWDTRWRDPNSTATVELMDRPISEPLSLADARDHLRLVADVPVGSPPDFVHPDDGFLTGYAIGAAREYCEQMISRSLAPQRFKLRLDGFPWSQRDCWQQDFRTHSEIRLPMAAPLIQIESFTYTDSTGATVAMAQGVDYILRARGEPATVMPLYGGAWPTAGNVPESVQIVYTAGYGDPGESGSPNHDATPPLPYLAAAGIRLMLGHLYENREEVVVGQRVVSIQLSIGVASVLAPLNLNMGIA